MNSINAIVDKMCVYIIIGYDCECIVGEIRLEKGKKLIRMPLHVFRVYLWIGCICVEFKIGGIRWKKEEAVGRKQKTRPSCFMEIYILYKEKMHSLCVFVEFPALIVHTLV